MPLTTRIVRGANAERVLLLVHGLGADEHDLAGLVPHLDPDGKLLVVLPRGPYSAPPGYSWFQFGPAMSGTLLSSLDAVDEVLDSACDQYGMPRGQAIVGGFSQGCALTLALGLRKGHEHPLGILAMSGFLPPEERLEYDWETVLPPVLMQHGSQDPMIPAVRGRESAETLAAHGVPVVYREYPMQHQVSLESMRDAAEWVGKVVAGERPSEPIATEAPADNGPVSHVSAATFQQEVLSSELPVIVDFWAPWCQPCRQVAPIVEQIANMRKGRYKVVKLNIDEAPEIAQQYQVQSIPMIGLFRNGRLERRSVGAKPRQQLEAELGMLVIP